MTFDNMILGEDVVVTTDCSKTGLNNNVFVCAGSGGGKTMSVIEARLLETYCSSLIVTVTKRRIVEKYKPLFKERGYNVLDMNFADPTKGNCFFDFLEYIKDDTDVRHLAESIVLSNPRKEKSTSADPYWDMMAVNLLTAEIALIMKMMKTPTFNDVLKLNDCLGLSENDSGITTNLDEMFEVISSADPHGLGAVCWNSFKCLPIKTAGCVSSELNAALDSIFPPAIREALAGKNKIHFEQIASEKTVLFITTSPVNPALNCLVNVFYSVMFKQLFEYAEAQFNGQLPVPVGVLCDDFAVGGKILNFPEYISIFREKRLSVVLLVQSESQLKAIYDEDNAKTIINNCDTYIFMGGMDLQTGKNISERLNVPLEDVLYMQLGKEIIFRRGQRPIITQRYNILDDKRYIEATKVYERSIAKKRFSEMIKGV